MHVIIVVKSDHCWHAAKVNHVENISQRKGIIAVNYRWLSVINFNLDNFLSLKLTCHSKSSADCNVITRCRKVFSFSNRSYSKPLSLLWKKRIDLLDCHFCQYIFFMKWSICKCLPSSASPPFVVDHKSGTNWNINNQLKQNVSENKKVLPRERKRHTARRVSSTPPAVLSQ